MNKELELIEKVQDWAKVRGLYDEGNPQAQLLKLVEELGELQEATCDEEAQDAVGDFIVVTINLMTLLGYCNEDIRLTISSDYSNIQNQQLLMGKLAEMVLKPNKFNAKEFRIYLSKLIQSLPHWNSCNRLCLLEQAYTIIANRKGKMVNGNFVKDE